VQALITVWQHITWDDAWELDRCVDALIEGIAREDDAVPDLRAEFAFLRQALLRLDPHDERIPIYEQLLADLGDPLDDVSSSESSDSSDESSDYD